MACYCSYCRGIIRRDDEGPLCGACAANDGLADMRNRDALNHLRRIVRPMWEALQPFATQAALLGRGGKHEDEELPGLSIRPRDFLAAMEAVRGVNINALGRDDG